MVNRFTRDNVTTNLFYKNWVSHAQRRTVTSNISDVLRNIFWWTYLIQVKIRGTKYCGYRSKHFYWGTFIFGGPDRNFGSFVR